MRTKIIKIGNSCGIIIPSGVLKTLGVAEKSSVSITLSGDGMTIKKT
ncbi:AbrB/MazE/SpoVT family DNA-binding domain-containing protein, partial [uncultured Porphyromonas sp.]